MVEDFYRALRVFWAPTAALSDAVDRPIVAAPLLVPTAFATLTSLAVYFRFPPSDPSLTGIWFVALTAGALGPLVLAALVSAFFSLVFRMFGAKRSWTGLLSITALAFMPSALYHAAQAVALLVADSGTRVPPQLRGFNLARLLDPEDSSRLLAAASMLDVVSIWILVLLAVGYRLLDADGSRRAVFAVVASWIVWACLRIAFADQFGF